MPIYTIRDNQTGRTLRVEGDTPPTPEDIEEIFSSQPTSDTPPPTPEMVPMAPGVLETVKKSAMQAMAGGSFMEPFRQREAALAKEEQVRASNLQGQLGLDAPVAPASQGGVGAGERAMSAIAPSQQDEIQAGINKYGEGGYIPLQKGKALVRVPDGKGGFQFVLNNPSGFDVGDIASFAAQAPQVVASIAGAQVAKAPVASNAASAIAANTVGAIQDVIYRAANGLPVDMEEIGKRRGMSTAVETFLGAGVQKGLTAGMGKVAATKAGRDAFKAFNAESEAAQKFLEKSGVRTESAAQAAESTRKLVGPGSPAEAGNAIAAILTDQDRQLAKASELGAEGFARNVERRAIGAIERSTSPTAPSAKDSAANAISKATAAIEQQKAAVGAMYDDAFAKIDEELAAANLPPSFINLEATASLIRQAKEKLLKEKKIIPAKDTGIFDASGRPVVMPSREVEAPSDLYAPLLSTLDKIESATGTAQKLDAVRQLRSYIGSKKSAGQDPLPGLEDKAKSSLYRALTNDIDNATAKLGGQGGQALKAANAAYKQLVQPVEDSTFLNKMLTGGFESPEKMVDYLVSGSAGSSEWAALRKAIDPSDFALLRRSAVDRLRETAKVRIGEREFEDIGKLGRNLQAMSPEVKNELFGKPAAWQTLEDLGKEFQFIADRKGVFSSYAMPEKAAIDEAMRVAADMGYTQGRRSLKAALDAADQRRQNLAANLTSQIRNGNTKQAVENPAAFFDALVLSGKYSPEYVEGVLNKLAPTERKVVQDTAFQSIFDRARSLAFNAVDGKLAKSITPYDVESLSKSLFGGTGVYGSVPQQKVMRAALGTDNYDKIKALIQYQGKLMVEASNKKDRRNEVARLIALAPFPNLFAANATSIALNKASGLRLIKDAPPGLIEQFSKTRIARMMPEAMRVGATATLQYGSRQATDRMFNDYTDMMNGLTPEQQEAVDDYLLGRR